MWLGGEDLEMCPASMVHLALHIPPLGLVGGRFVEEPHFRISALYGASTCQDWTGLSRLFFFSFSRQRSVHFLVLLLGLKHGEGLWLFVFIPIEQEMCLRQ